MGNGLVWDLEGWVKSWENGEGGEKGREVTTGTSFLFSHNKPMYLESPSSQFLRWL